MSFTPPILIIFVSVAFPEPIFIDIEFCPIFKLLVESTLSTVKIPEMIGLIIGKYVFDKFGIELLIVVAVFCNVKICEFILSIFVVF